MSKELTDKTETVRLDYCDRTTLHVSTYKTSITLHSSRSEPSRVPEIIWMTAKDAERVGRALLRAASLRQRIDRARKKP